MDSHGLYFPTARGVHATKPAMVCMMERLAGMCGEDLVDDIHGVNKYGGHTARVEGVRRVISIGLESLDTCRGQPLARRVSPRIS
eukprot:5692861-Amphidinium_carterae.3